MRLPRTVTVTLHHVSDDEPEGVLADAEEEGRRHRHATACNESGKRRRYLLITKSITQIDVRLM